MVIASGFVEVNEDRSMDKIVGEMKKRGLNIDEVESGKILFLMERETLDAIKTEIGSLRSIAEVKNIHITYYSFENGK